MPYSLHDYCQMLADRRRMQAYVSALRQSLRPGDVMLDLGAGFGFFSVLACQLGARKVYTIESQDAIHHGKELARANGVADRIEFIQGMSWEVDLPERVDLILSDLRGALPLFREAVPTLIDARRRFLKPGGKLLPVRDVLKAALLAAPDLYEKTVRPCKDDDHGVDLTTIEHRLANEWHREKLGTECLITEPVEWAVLDYGRIESANIANRVRWALDRECQTHGLAVWMEATIAEGCTIDVAPGTPSGVYTQAYFPFLKPMELGPGQEVQVDLQARLVGPEYVWRWVTSIRSPRHGSEWNQVGDQSTFAALPLDPNGFRKQLRSSRVRLMERGRLDLLVLRSLSEGRTLADTAEQVRREFSRRFPEDSLALAYVQRMAATHGDLGPLRESP